MKKTMAVVVALVAMGSMAAWKDFTPENYVCGPKLTADGLKGKVVLVDKWATWCGPCRAMMPHTEAIAKKFKNRSLIVVGSHVARGFDKARVEQYVKENNFSFSFYKDAGWDGDVGYDGGIPFLYVVDKKGTVVYGGRNADQVEKAIVAALGKAGGDTFIDEKELVEYKSLKGKLVPGKNAEMIVKRLKTDVAMAQKNPTSATLARKRPEAEKIVASVEEYKKNLIEEIGAKTAEGDNAAAIKYIDLLVKTWPSEKKEWAAKANELKAKLASQESKKGE